MATPTTGSSFREAIENFGKQLRTVDCLHTIVAESKSYSLATLQKEDTLLNLYKSQHQLERGFRFIKDPEILASSFYVKKPGRAEALLFVMTTCLLVYAALERRVGEALKKPRKRWQTKRANRQIGLQHAEYSRYLSASTY